MRSSNTSSVAVQSSNGGHSVDSETIQHSNRDVEILRASQPLHVSHTPLETHYNVIVVSLTA